MSDTVKTDLIDSVEDSNSTTTTTNSTVTNTGTTVTKNSNTDSTTVDGEKKSVLKDYYAVLGRLSS